MATPTQRTLDALKEQGALCGIVERFIKDAGPLIFTINPVTRRRMGKHTGVRKDLFGIIDIIALFPDRGRVCGIQSCGTAFSEHKKKILENKYSQIWLRYADLELWGWRKLGPKDKKKYVPRIYKFSLADWL